MRFKKILSFICLAGLFLNICACLIITPASAVGKETVKRTIAIVYDNSGSMFRDFSRKQDVKAWCQALYAIEVFASMMNDGDKLMVYPMNPMGPDGGNAVYNRSTPLVINNASEISKLKNLKSYLLTDEDDDTPIEPIDYAAAALKKENADQKWLVIVTDGAEFYEDGKALGKGQATKSALEFRLNKYITDSNILYLAINAGDKPIVPEMAFGGSHVYAAREAKAESVPQVLTEMCNMIFGRDDLGSSDFKNKFLNLKSKKINFDIPLSKLYVFIQGDGIENVKLMKDGEELKSTKTFAPAYNTAGCEYTYVKNPLVDTSLKGYVAEFVDLDPGTYTYSHSGQSSSVAFYYEVDADLRLLFTRPDGTVITEAEQVAPGDYTLEYALVDKDENILKSDLLGDVNFDLDYSINGKGAVEKGKSSGKMALHVDEETEFVLNSAEVNFLSGYKIRKTGSKLGFLSIPFRGIKGAAKPFQVKLSGGTKSTDADLVGEVPAYIATLIYDGKQLSGNELDDVQFSAEISGSGIKCDVKRTDSGFEVKLVPEEGLKVVPNGTYDIKVNAIVSSETLADSSAQAKATLRVREVSDRLSMNLSCSNTIFSTVDPKKVPEIIATVRLNQEKLTHEQFEKLVVTAESDGASFVITPLPDKSAYRIMLNIDPAPEKGDYSVNITASGITARNGDALSATSETGIRVQLLPQWVVYLLWIIAILIVLLLIWLWLRTPVLPKGIKLSNISVRVGGTEMKALKATVIYPPKGKQREIKIKGTGSLSNANWKATLIPAKDSYRYLPSKNRKAVVINGSIKSSGNVSRITIGAESFSRDANNKLCRMSKSEKNFNLPKTRMNYSGTVDMGGDVATYSITGNIIFE